MIPPRDVEAVDFSASSAPAPPIPHPPKCSYFISSYPTHECRSGWLSWPLPLLSPLPHPWFHHQKQSAKISYSSTTEDYDKKQDIKSTIGKQRKRQCDFCGHERSLFCIDSIMPFSAEISCKTLREMFIWSPSGRSQVLSLVNYLPQCYSLLVLYWVHFGGTCAS